MKEIAKRAVALEGKGWRWMEGMGIWIGGSIVKRCVGVGKLGPIYRNGYGFLSEVPFALPALDDPATLGCLRHLATVAHGAFDVTIQTGIAPRMDGIHGRWRAVDSQGRLLRTGGFVMPFDGDAMAHGLVAALEAAS